MTILTLDELNLLIMLPEKCKLPFFFDHKELKNDLIKAEGTEWINHFVQQHYEGDWSVIPLRGPKGAQHPIQMIFSHPGVEEFEDTPMLSPCETFKKIIDSFQTEVKSVRLMKLGPGSTIKEHRDHDLDFEGIVRIHVPVVTDDEVEFYLNDKRITMKEGECWYLRLSDPHMVVNNTNISRVHMVLDMEINPWLEGLLTA